MWIPLNVDTSGVPLAQEAGAVHEALTAQVGPPAVSVPTPDDLNTWAQETYVLSRSEASSAGFSTIITADVKGEQRVYVAETSRYKEVPDTKGGFLRYGVALRLVVHAIELEGSASLSLPTIAAKVQYG